jgi:hypothetical protein
MRESGRKKKQRVNEMSDESKRKGERGEGGGNGKDRERIKKNKVQKLNQIFWYQ